MVPMVLDRLLLQFSGFFIIIFIYFAKKNEKKNKKALHKIFYGKGYQNLYKGISGFF